MIWRNKDKSMRKFIEKNKISFKKYENEREKYENAREK